MQPLVKAKGIACFGLIQSNINGTWKYLVKLYHEIGSFDKAEFGPSVQLEFTHNSQENDVIENYFFDYALKKEKYLLMCYYRKKVEGFIMNKIEMLLYQLTTRQYHRFRIIMYGWSLAH